MDRGGGRARGDAAQPGRGQLGRAAVAVTGGPSPRGGRWMAACVRLRGPAGHGRCPCGQELRKGAGGTLKSTPPIEQRTAGNGQKPTRGDPGGGARAGGGSERLRAGEGRLGPGCVAPVGRARRSAGPGPGPGAPRAGRSGRRSGEPNAQASGPGGRPGPSGAPGSQAAPLRPLAREGASRRLLQRRLQSSKRLS